MIKRILTALFITLLPLATIFSQSSKGLERTATSTITTETDKNGVIIVRTVNRRFTFTDYLPENIFTKSRYRTLLFHEEFRSERYLNQEADQATVKVEAFLGRDANPTEKIWTLEEAGNLGERFERFYRVTRFGCCNSEPTYHYFNLASGKKVFTATTPLQKVDIPNGSIEFSRYLSYHSINGSLRPAEKERVKDLVGVIQYGSEAKELGRLLVRTSFGDYVGSPELSLRHQEKTVKNETLMLWNADKQKGAAALSDFSLIVSFGALGDIIIPITNDHFDTDRATLPKNFFIE